MEEMEAGLGSQIQSQFFEQYLLKHIVCQANFQHNIWVKQPDIAGKTKWLEFRWYSPTIVQRLGVEKNELFALMVIFSIAGENKDA